MTTSRSKVCVLKEYRIFWKDVTNKLVTEPGKDPFYVSAWVMSPVLGLNFRKPSAMVSHKPHGNRWVDVGQEAFLMQCTGLVDSEGMRIFEGDFVRYSGFYINKIIEMNGLASIIEVKDLLDRDLSVLVVGNVHQGVPAL